MSTEMKTSHPSYTLLQFWGGNANGKCISIGLPVVGGSHAFVNMTNHDVKNFLAGEKVKGTFYDSAEEMLQVSYHTPVHMSVRRVKHLVNDLNSWLVDKLDSLY